MIIDCDTHFLPPDAYDYMGDEWDALRPRFVFDAQGCVTAIDFPGAPPPVPGATPLAPPGTGARYGGMYDMDERLRDYEKLGMPLFLHNIQHGHRITNLMNYQFNGLDALAPQVGQMSLVSPITSGLLDEFPRLNFVFTEAGVSFIKPLNEHLDSVFDHAVVDYEAEDAAPRFNYRKLTGGKRIVSEEDYQAKNKLAPSRYFKTNLHFTIETEEPELAEAVRCLGARQFLFATDYPHDDPGGRMKYKDVELFNANRAIAEADKALIWHKNAHRLLGQA